MRGKITALVSKITEETEKLSLQFGVGVSNPLYSGMNITELLRLSVKEHLGRAHLLWESTINTRREDRDRLIFRAAAAYVEGIIYSARECTGNSAADRQIAREIHHWLNELMISIDRYAQEGKRSNGTKSKPANRCKAS